MDPLSVTASVITVIQAAEAVISICCRYRSSVTGSRWEVSRILEDTRSLRSILQKLEGLVDKAETSDSAEQSRLPALRSLCDRDTGTLSNCYDDLDELKSKLDPSGRSGPTGSKRRALVEALKWPLKKKDVEKILDKIASHKDTISVALHADQIPSILAIEDATQETKVSLTSLKNSTHKQSIRNWLHGIDPDPKYAKTIEDREPETGAWLTNTRTFEAWKRGRDSRLWLYGIPGCGKTFLCSTAIEHVLEERQMSTDKAIGVAYFYFDFNNYDQQYCDTMLRSLVSQLWLQSRGDGNPVDALYSACGSGASQPSSNMLKNALKDLVQNSVDTFILLDALDECKERQRLMPIIEEMAKWKVPSLHMLFTSRKEKDIEESLSTILDEEQQICIQSALVADDIRKYVRSRIRSDRDLRKWQKPEVQTEIETVLTEKAGGMFQWVKCQLDALGRCLSLSSLRKALRSLPKDLDDTYARILQSIEHDEHSKLVFMIVQWLAYSERPMLLTEISEALTVDPENDLQFDMDRRLEDPRDLLRICSSLVTTVPRPEHPYIQLESAELLQFAHFSVREYLESPRIQEGPAKKYAIQEICSNNFIAESCIIYLLHLQLPQVINSLSKEYPFFEYASTNWSNHAERTGEDGNIIALGKSFVTSKVYELPWPYTFGDREVDWYCDAQGKYLPLLYASILNVPKITRALIVDGADVNGCNTHGWTPLMEMSQHRDERIELVQLLLKHGADVNARSEYGLGQTALKLAARNGKLQLVRILLDNGADIDEYSQGDAPLTHASRAGQSEIVQLLLDCGASISNSIGVGALHCASYYGDLKTAEMLLKRGIGADVELDNPGIQRTRSDVCIRGLSCPICNPMQSFTTPLLRSLDQKEKEVAELLLKYGADVNARSEKGRRRAVALQHALECGDDFMVDFLVEHGADPSLVPEGEISPQLIIRYEKKFPQSDIMGVRAVALKNALEIGDYYMVDFLVDEHGADQSLVKPEDLSVMGVRRYNEKFLKNESQWLREKENEDALAPSYYEY